VNESRQVGKTARRPAGATQAAPAPGTAAESPITHHPSPITLDLGERGTVTIVPDGSALAKAATERFAEAVERAVAARGQAFVALSGGSTPKQMGTILAREPYRSRIPWDRVQIFWGDERWVPRASTESNAGEARRGFLDLVPIPPANVHPWDTDADSPEEAATAYEAELRQAFGGTHEIPRFDFVLLGMGDDGHTASLFPGTRALDVTDRLAVANFVPKLDTTRLTLTAPVLNAGREILFLVGGPGKADRLEAVLEGPVTIVEQPAQMIRAESEDGTLGWLVDVDAARDLNALAR
jgi:6-phosphogluconolactonase